MVCFRVSGAILHKESTVTITVLSKPSCVQCTATYRKLDAEKLEYSPDDIYEESNLAVITELGYKAAPVVLVRDEAGTIIDHWAGFRPDKISGLASELKAA
jgi:glutaredoxin-like protein NrdH